MQNYSSIDVDDLEGNLVISSLSKDSSKKQTQTVTRSRTSLSYYRKHRERKKKVCQARTNKTKDKNKNKPNRRAVKIANNTSLIFSENKREWKENVSGFQRDVLTNDNKKKNDDDNEHINRSSSSSPVAAVAEFLIQRQRRKQTRLKGKTGSEKRKKEKKKKKKKEKKKKERNKKSPSSTTEAEATDASLFQFSAVDTSTGFYPHEQPRCADKSTTNEQNRSSKQTTAKQQQHHPHHHYQRQKQESEVNVIMPDGYNHTADSNPTVKKKENLRILVRNHRRQLIKQSKRNFHYSSTSSTTSNTSHETISSTSTSNVDELVQLIEKKINCKQKKNSRQNKNIIIVNYKPVFVNSQEHQQKQTKKPSNISTVERPQIILTDDDFSSATHYSRRRSLTTTSSDGSSRRSTSNRSQHQSLSVDLPDVEDPLVFIEMMYQQLFTEDGRLRSGTEPTALANCVKQIVTNSRRNSISSSIANGSTSSAHAKQMKSIRLTKPKSTTSSPRFIPDESYETYSDDDEDDDEELETIIQSNPTRSDLSKRNSKRIINRDNNISQTQTLYQDRQHLTVNNTFSFSIDDTDNEDLDTFSDFNSARLNTKPSQISPSFEDDLTHTDSKLLSSSGYHSSDRPKQFFQSRRLIRSKSHSETDLTQKSSSSSSPRENVHYCPNCTIPPTITVISPSNSSLNFFQRIQQPLGLMLMKYLNFLFISKHVLLLPLFIFLLRQRSMHIGN